MQHNPSLNQLNPRRTHALRAAALTWWFPGACVLLLQLLFRVQVKEWLKLMIAPLSGGLEALGRSITPVRGG